MVKKNYAFEITDIISYNCAQNKVTQNISDTDPESWNITEYNANNVHKSFGTE